MSLWSKIAPETQRAIARDALATGLWGMVGAACLAALCLHFNLGWWTVCAEGIYWGQWRLSTAWGAMLAAALEADS